MFREKKVFSSCLSLSTYYRVLQVGSVTKDVENTIPAPTLQGMTTVCVEKIKQKLFINSDLIQPLIPNIHAKVHHFIKNRKKPENL